MRPRKKLNRYQRSVRCVARAARQLADRLGGDGYQDSEFKAFCLEAACELYRIRSYELQRARDRQHEREMAMLRDGDKSTEVETVE